MAHQSTATYRVGPTWLPARLLRQRASPQSRSRPLTVRRNAKSWRPTRMWRVGD